LWLSGRDQGGKSVLGGGFDDGLGADEDAGFAEEVEAFDVNGATVKLGDDDG